MAELGHRVDGIEMDTVTPGFDVQLLIYFGSISP